MSTVSRLFPHNVSPVRVLVRKYHCKRGTTKVMWEKPEIGWTKLNYDGSCKWKTGKSSIGGIIRNHNADFVLGYAECIGKSTSVIAEFAALNRGLEIVLENGWRDVWLEGDCKLLVDIITKRRKVRCPQVEMHVENINLIIPEIKNCRLTHVYREGNRAADKFAALGYNYKSPQIWREKCPGEVLKIVNEDAQGRTFFRKR